MSDAAQAAAQEARNKLAAVAKLQRAANAEAAQIIRDAKAADPDKWTAIVSAKISGDDDDAAAAQDGGEGARPTTEAAEREARMKKEMVKKLLELELFKAAF